MRSLRAIRQPQTPSSTKSPSTCGGKCFLGFLSHSRICSRRSFARARMAIVDIMDTIRTLPNYGSTASRDSPPINPSMARIPICRLPSIATAADQMNPCKADTGYWPLSSASWLSSTVAHITRHRCRSGRWWHGCGHAEYGVSLSWYFVR